MKVKEIYIKEFRQFKDFTLDLTYPTGHAKAGLPLDKVCFIGQSGTGKTNLLKLIYLIRMPSDFNKLHKLNAAPTELIDKVGFSIVTSLKEELITSFKESKKRDFAEENLMSVFDVKSSEIGYGNMLDENYVTPHGDLEIISKFLSNESKSNGKLMYFPSHLKYDLGESIIDNNNQSKKIYDFSKENIYSLWSLITKDVTKYQEEELKIRQKISVLAEQGDINAIQNEVANLKEWKERNTNPIKSIAEKCINPLVKNFSLKVKEESSIEQKEDIGFIKLESLVGKEIPYNSWSTGTKQVVLSALPLYLIQPENSTILFDEPETSLYPDLQRIIIDYYSSLVRESNQFFYATHSPIIASSFEPWEIVELKFNEEGFVERELYYEGENHIDNYYIDPRFLNFDLTLEKVFDMEFTSGDKRLDALTRYGMLRNQLDMLKKGGQLQTDEAKLIYKEFKSLSKKLAINPTQYA